MAGQGGASALRGAAQITWIFIPGKSWLCWPPRVALAETRRTPLPPQPSGCFSFISWRKGGKKGRQRNILQGLKERYEEYHGVIIEDDAVSTCVELSIKHIHNRFLPDKAVDLLDQSCACVRVEGKTTLSAQDIVNLLSRQKGTAIKENEILNDLETQLNRLITGQQKAVKAMATALKRWQAGFKNDNTPIATFMFCGP